MAEIKVCDSWGTYQDPWLCLQIGVFRVDDLATIWATIGQRFEFTNRPKIDVDSEPPPDFERFWCDFDAAFFPPLSGFAALIHLRFYIGILYLPPSHLNNQNLIECKMNKKQMQNNFSITQNIQKCIPANVFCKNYPKWAYQRLKTIYPLRK